MDTEYKRQYLSEDLEAIDYIIRRYINNLSYKAKLTNAPSTSDLNKHIVELGKYLAGNIQILYPNTTLSMEYIDKLWKDLRTNSPDILSFLTTISTECLLSNVNLNKLADTIVDSYLIKSPDLNPNSNSLTFNEGIDRLKKDTVTGYKDFLNQNPWLIIHFALQYLNIDILIGLM